MTLKLKNVVIIGATSSIAIETASILANQQGCAFFLVARDRKKLVQTITQLKQYGAGKIDSATLDITNFPTHKSLIQRAWKSLGSVDLLLIAHGSLPNQQICEQDFHLAEKEFRTNFISTMSLLTEAATYFEQQKKGMIAVISSVAGDRGRQSNYIYGAAKGALNIFLQGLRNRLFASNVHVLTIKPGFVSTPLTEKLPQGRLYVKPEVVAKGIIKAIASRKNEIYLPTFWYWIMLIIKFLPEWLFKRLKL